MPQMSPMYWLLVYFFSLLLLLLFMFPIFISNYLVLKENQSKNFEIFVNKSNKGLNLLW